MPRNQKRSKRGYRVFKPTHQGGESKRWAVEFRCHNTDRTRPRRLSGFTDREATEEMGRNIARLVSLRAAGGSPDLELTRWLERAPKNVKTRLAEWGIIDADRLTGSKRLKDHLSDFEESLRARGNTDRHVKLVVSRIRKITEAAGMTHWSDITADRVRDKLRELRRGTEDSKGISAQTHNFYLQAMKQFCRWMVRNQRSSTSPLEYLEAEKNVGTKRQFERRAFSPDEVRYLVQWCESAGHRNGMTGPERAVLYRLAVETGLRAGELRQLTPGDFALDADEPHVHVAASKTKNRQVADIMLRPDTAKMLGDYLRGRERGESVFPMPRRENTAAMLKADLGQARVAWIAEAQTDADRREREESDFLRYTDAADRRADFHALRHTTGSWLASAGVHPKIIQRIMRHSSIGLTMDRYAHAFLGDEGRAIAKLPGIGSNDGAEGSPELGVSFGVIERTG